MANKLPSQYPPELPALLASRIVAGSEKEEFKSGVILGPDLPADLIEIVRSRKNTLEIGKENENAGMSILSFDDDNCAISFSCDIEESDDAHESMAIALHVFKYLKVEKATFLDGVYLLDRSKAEIVVISDHINMTGINPLKYWMLSDDPDPFFLDTKNLYNQIGPSEIEGLVHFSSCDSDLLIMKHKAHEASAETYGKAFLPETILAGYLGMKVSAIGFNLDINVKDINALIEHLFEIINQ